MHFKATSFFILNCISIYGTNVNSEFKAIETTGNYTLIKQQYKLFENCLETSLYQNSNDSSLLAKLVNVTMVLKDGTKKVNCTIREIKGHYLVYEKNKVLHDILIDKIKWFQLSDSKNTIVRFDNNGQLYYEYIRSEEF